MPLFHLKTVIAYVMTEISVVLINFNGVLYYVRVYTDRSTRISSEIMLVTDRIVL